MDLSRVNLVFDRNIGSVCGKPHPNAKPKSLNLCNKTFPSKAMNNFGCIFLLLAPVQEIKGDADIKGQFKHVQ